MMKINPLFNNQIRQTQAQAQNKVQNNKEEKNAQASDNKQNEPTVNLNLSQNAINYSKAIASYDKSETVDEASLEKYKAVLEDWQQLSDEQTEQIAISLLEDLT